MSYQSKFSRFNQQTSFKYQRMLVDTRDLDQRNSLNMKETEAIKHDNMTDHISKRNSAGSVADSQSLP